MTMPSMPDPTTMPSPRDAIALTDSSRSPYVRLRAVGLDGVRWTGGSSANCTGAVAT